MSIDSILDEIDVEIERLEQARAAIAGVARTGKAVTKKKPTKRRKLSANARKAISDAQRKRWAAVKKVAK